MSSTNTKRLENLETKLNVVPSPVFLLVGMSPDGEIQFMDMSTGAISNKLPDAEYVITSKTTIDLERL